MRSESERFWDLIESASPDHSKCWVWGGALTSRGYGHFRAADGTYVLAHRWSYERYVDEIPKGLVLDHLCEVQRCVNPHHLEPVTQHENVRRWRSLHVVK